MAKLPLRNKPKLIVPPLTPFNKKLKVDAAALRGIVDYVVGPCGADIVIAAGVEAQEYQYLPQNERRELIRQTIKFVDGRADVAVGITHPSFKEAVKLAHFAEENGATSLQLLAPNKPTGGVPTTSELIRYFELIAKETSLPIILYLNAGPGSDLSISQTIELAKLDCIWGIKESSRDLSRITRLISEIDLAGHAEYFTTMQVLLITMELGGSGVTLPPPASRLARLLIDSYLAGDLNKAIQIQNQFARFPSQWMPYGLAATMKAALNRLGVPAGDPYPPYAPVSGDALDALHAFLDSNFSPSKA